MAAPRRPRSHASAEDASSMEPRPDEIRRGQSTGLRPRLVRRREMRQLVRMRLAERRTAGPALYVGFARGALAAGATVRNAQPVRHHHVGHGYTLCHPPVPFSHHALPLCQSLFLPSFHPFFPPSLPLPFPPLS